MKYIRTYETEEKFLTDKDSASRGFRLKPTLYKYSEAGDHVHLENDDPRKHEGSTWIHMEFTKATEFSFKISNITGDDSNTLNYTIDWGDGTVEANTAVQGTDGLYTFTHNYAIGTYDMELYGTDRSYMFVGNLSSKPSHSYFSNPYSIRRVILGSGVEVDKYAFQECYFTSINIPEGVTSIGSSAFAQCRRLTSINLPSTLTSIGSGVFIQCDSLTSINLPSTLTSIGGSVFSNCSKLTSITIPEGVTSIGNYTFNGCSSLTSISIPEGVTSIGNWTFNNCSSLTSISSYNATAPTLGTKNVFTSMPSNGTLHIKAGATGYDAWKSQLPSGWTIVEDL